MIQTNEKVRYLQQKFRKARTEYFLDSIPENSTVLEIGGGENWVRTFFARKHNIEYISIDLVPPSDIVGDIRNWKSLGLGAECFDFIIAFEVLEHVDCLKECMELLKPNGQLLVTTPVPHFDWILRYLEMIGLNQKRTSPHCNLLYLNDIKGFSEQKVVYKFGLSQWAKFRK